MSSFTDPLTVTKISGGKWRVRDGFTYFIGEENSNNSVIIPDGFETDFASVPRGLWNIFPPDGQYSQAAVLHDFIYKYKIFPRKECDKIFLEAMKVLKVGFITRRLMYRAVRMFGGLSWNR